MKKPNTQDRRRICFMCGRYRKLRYLKNDVLMKKPRCFDVSICLAIAQDKVKGWPSIKQMEEDAKNHD